MTDDYVKIQINDKNVVILKMHLRGQEIKVYIELKAEAYIKVVNLKS